MGNTFFKFKQFTIHQEEAALKVCTEACLFGSLIPVQQSKRILDIGTGTGLLALMMAQRNPHAFIEAIELDLPSSRDAQKNFMSSPWKDRLTLHVGDIKTFSSPSSFDLIVCNPPFFIDQLKSNDSRTNAALHGSELKPEELSEIIKPLSHQESLFYVLLPDREMAKLSLLLEQEGWQAIEEIDIHQTQTQTIFRKIKGFQFSAIPPICKHRKIVIYQTDRSYTEEFHTLLKEFYLYL